MLHESNQDEYHKAGVIFDRLPRTAVAGTLAGLTPGRVFVDDAQEPSAAFTWNDYRFSYLAGDPANEPFLRELASLLDSRAAAAGARLARPERGAVSRFFQNGLMHSTGRLSAYRPLRLFRSLHRFDPDRHSKNTPAFWNHYRRSTRCCPSMPGYASASRTWLLLTSSYGAGRSAF